ncbi:MAG: ATP-binding cassette domain-containing protein, partial [Lachnospiraceae bacterium]|nr:ATP-binding cassette domain-containing protein [Lachnospiraceae bacterium]
MNDLLLCQKLSKRFDSKYALTDVDLTLERGRIVGLLGPNSSGKTTLIKLITGLLSPTEGTITINGMAPGVETKRLVSYLPERPCLNAGLRVKDLLKFFSRFYDNFNRERALAMLSDLNISTGDRLKTMSKGTKEKVQLILVMSR